MRTGKILGMIVGGVIGLLVIVLLSVRLFVNPNNYKPQIAAAVKKSTGRELDLPGDIELSVFPWIALQLGPASLGNPAGFGSQPFVSFQHASVRAKLLPLLAKRLEIGRIELDGLDLRLIKNAEGKGNWEGFGKTDAAEPPEAKTDPNSGAAAPGSSPAATSSGPATLQGLNGIKITHARLSYQNFVLDNLNLETGAFGGGQVTPITLHVDADRGVAGEKASLDAKLNLNSDADMQRLEIAALNLDGSISQAGSTRPITWNLSTPHLAVDLDAQTLALPAFTLTLAGAQLTGNAAGTKIKDDPHLTGALTLAPLVVREFLPRLGMEPPKTRDPRALSEVSLSTQFAYGGNAARLDKLAVVLDDTHLTGSAGVSDLKTDALVFDLAVDKLDADRYLAPEGQTPVPKPAVKAPEPAAAPKPLEANGTLTVGSLHFSPLDLTQVKVTVASTGGVLHIYPLQAEVDGGQYSGNVTLDGREPVPLLSLDEHLTGIDVGKLVSTGSKKIHVVGKGNVTLKASGRGATSAALTKTLAGRLDTVVNNGAVEGIDVGYELGRAEALIRRQPAPATANANRTPFDVLKMSADIANGVASTKDLTVSSPVLKVTGQGTANLVSLAIDFSLLADTLKTAGNTPIQVPIKVTGTASDPTIRPDIEALAKGQLKQKVQDVLQDKLKGLFH